MDAIENALFVLIGITLIIWGISLTALQFG